MDLKTRLHNHLFTLLKSRKSTLQAQRNQLSVESSESGKGSAGDKHEVGIAMAQLEVEKLDKQIVLLQQQLAVLQKLNPKHENNQVLHGALFRIDENWYYCSISFGQISLDETNYFCLSPEAPLFMALKGKKVNEQATFNQKFWQIQQIL